MRYLVDIFLIIVLLFVAFQDFRFRAISIWTLPLIVIPVVFINVGAMSAKSLLINTMINVLFFFFQITLVTLYFSIKHKKFTNIINTYMGLGDILFIASVAFMFSPVLFITFLIIGLSIVGMLYGIAKLLLNYSKETIPLAGGLSLMLALLWTAKIIGNFKQVYSFAALENLIIR
jgi:hypothetical protein